VSATPPHSSDTLMRCADVAPYLSAFADGELAEPLRSRVTAHLTTCEACSRQVERYASIDAALARLPRTAPAAEVYERVSAAVARQPVGPAVRESLAGRRRALRRRRLEFAEWASRDAPATASAAHSHRRRGWVASALPTMAALLLIALTGVIIHGALPGPTTTNPPTPPALTGTPLEQTHDKMQAAMAGKSMAFTPVYPTYLPAAPTFQRVDAQVSPTSSGGFFLLDVTWTLTGPVQQVHLREGPKGSEWSDYLPTSALPVSAQEGLAWQVGQHPWLPLAKSDALDRPAIGQDRGDVWLALDATVSSGDPMNPSALAKLRLISLSMDLPYQQEPQQIFPAPSNVVFHYTAELGGSGASYVVDGYDNAAQHAARVAVSRNGTPYYTDIVRDQQGIRLDPAHHTYQLRSAASLTAAALPQGATHVFFFANTLAQNGLLWNAGVTKYSGASVYDFQQVDAPSPTHVYVDQQSKVVAVVIDTNSNIHPGGASAASRFVGTGGCPRYTMIEDAQAAQPPSFSTTPPAGYTQGQVPNTVTC
jgi:hypothetical protein